MQSSISVLKPAEEYSLLTVHDARLGLNLSASSDLVDKQLDLFIRWASRAIARECNRVLAQETVEETILELEAPRIFLARYPVKRIETISENGVALTPDGYDLDTESGTLTRLNATWQTPVVVTYTGGYDMPRGAPPELAQAVMLLTREAYNAMLRGDSTVRMISHKESRIIYFDPNAHLGKAGGGVGSPTQRAVQDLLHHFMRFNV